MVDKSKFKNFLGYFNASLFFLVIFTYFIIVGVILRGILFNRFDFSFNASSIIFSNYHTLLLPYVFSSILCFILFFVFYNNSRLAFVDRIIKNSIYDNIIISIFLLILECILLFFLFYGPIFSKLFFIITLLYGILIFVFFLFFFFDFSKKYLLNIFISFFLIAISYEVLNIAFSKKMLMNEYQQLDEMTLMKGNFVSNVTFLKTLDRNEILQIYKKYEENNRISIKEGKRDVEIILEELMLNDKFEKYLITEDKEKLKNIVDFFSKNQVEYIHRNMSRGQIDHISYVLCPINEYINGRPLKEIYFQYGIGSAMIFKKVMDLFGGISFDNYYKTYILYLLYYFIFIFVFYKIFSNNFYFKTAILILILGFYINSYIGIILAPGINPILHFMDIIVLFLLFKYYLSRKTIYIILSGLSSIINIYINSNYGLMLYLAFIISLFFFFKENDYFKLKRIYLFFLSILFLLGFSFYVYLSKLTKTENLAYMIFGFFNFGYSVPLFFAVLLYITFGYVSLFIFRDLKNEFKYLFIFCFIYSIEMLTYYMQSGLYNHFNLPFAFIMLSFMFTLYIYENYYSNSEFREKNFSIFKKAFTLFLITLILLFAKNFYLGKFGKIKFYKIFNTHKLYKWTINKSDFYSTIPQSYIEDSLELIKRYAKEEKGIYIISKFDVLMTLFTDKYSKMLNFSLGPNLITLEDLEKNINILTKNKPIYIFIDNDLVKGDFNDPYSIIFDSDFNTLERQARFEKYNIMKKIFDSCADNYKFIEQSNLLSVYKLKKMP